VRESDRARLKGVRPSRRMAMSGGTLYMTNIGLTITQRALLSGEDLGAATIAWGGRPQPPPRFALTDRDLRLMALLYGANFLSMSHLTALGWRVSQERAAQMRLKRLHDAGYVDHFRPASAYGRAEWNYRLTSLGFSALKACEMVADERRFTPVPLTSISYAEHDLQLASVVLRIAQEAAGDAKHALIAQMPFRWLGPRNGHIEIDGDGETERSPAAQLPPGTHLFPVASRTGYLEPDATLIGGADDDLFAVLIEYDRTERPHKQIDRLRRYDRWLLDGWRKGSFASHAIAPAVIFLTSREVPLNRLIETADETFSAYYAPGEHTSPHEDTYPARERVLFASREQVFAGDWTMRRTPSMPAVLREEPGVCEPRLIKYELPSLFAAATRLASTD
jgi:protein involved in plasmid replication-relaxation